MGLLECTLAIWTGLQLYKTQVQGGVICQHRRIDAHKTKAFAWQLIPNLQKVQCCAAPHEVGTLNQHRGQDACA